ncbi:hypothetical protein H4582DRAFT_2124454 [Lactarius indigo]|nr:hypothetical protein H4582DRAFT_2124454 [Lactarius indigo]
MPPSLLGPRQEKSSAPDVERPSSTIAGKGNAAIDAPRDDKSECQCTKGNDDEKADNEGEQEGGFGRISNHRATIPARGFVVIAKPGRANYQNLRQSKTEKDTCVGVGFLKARGSGKSPQKCSAYPLTARRKAKHYSETHGHPQGEAEQRPQHRAGQLPFVLIGKEVDVVLMTGHRVEGVSALRGWKLGIEYGARAGGPPEEHCATILPVSYLFFGLQLVEKIASDIIEESHRSDARCAHGLMHVATMFDCIFSILPGKENVWKECRVVVLRISKCKARHSQEIGLIERRTWLQAVLVVAMRHCSATGIMGQSVTMFTITVTCLRNAQIERPILYGIRS